MCLSMSKLFLLNLMELGVTVFRGPDEGVWAELATHALPELLDRVQKISTFPAGPVRELADTLASRAHADDFSPLETEYVRLFIAGPGGIPAPLYESCHQETESRTMGRSALAMRDRLDQAGLVISLDSNEPPDHLTLELEYPSISAPENGPGRPNRRDGEPGSPPKSCSLGCAASAKPLPTPIPIRSSASRPTSSSTCLRPWPGPNPSAAASPPTGAHP